MTATALPADAPLDEGVIRRELLAALLAHERTVLGGNLALGSVAAGVLFAGSTVGLPIFGWLALLLGVVTGRVRAMRRLKTALPALGDEALADAERQQALWLGATGLAWGLLPLLAYTGDNPFADFFSIVMLIGMTAGALGSASALPTGLKLYIGGAYLPFIVQSQFIGGLITHAGGVAILITSLALLSFGRNAHRSMREALVVGRRNAHLAEALRRERDAVQALMRAKDLFQAGVTHDLRQPVHALALHLRYLRSLKADTCTPERVAQLCGPMELALRGMSQQLTRLLELARLEAGEAQALCQSVPLAALFESLAAQFEAPAREKGLCLRLRALDATLQTDARLLQSIVSNLVANAVRYTEQGGVLVAARRRGASLCVAVFDTGRGIEPEALPQVFMPYRRFDDRQHDDGEGQGLGLALASRQAALLGGEISVRSVPGKGSTFVLRLPASLLG
jgi:signal transduction histidine kinase